MRFIALDVHRDFCEVAIAEGGAVRPAGRVRTDPSELQLFAESLGADDEVVLEATATHFPSLASSSPTSPASCSPTRRRSRD